MTRVENANLPAKDWRFALAAPVGTSVAVARPPAATWGLTALNAVFLLFSELAARSTVAVYALDPDRFALHQLATHGFMHAAPAHFFWGAAFLAVFGPPVEQALGALRAIAVYLLSAAVAGLIYLGLARFAPFAPPLMGAGAGVAGLMGAFILLHPGASFQIGRPAQDEDDADEAVPGGRRLNLAWPIALFFALNALFAFWPRYENFSIMTFIAAGMGFFAGLGLAALAQHAREVPSSQKELADTSLQEQLELQLRLHEESERERRERLARPEPLQAHRLGRHSAEFSDLEAAVDGGDADLAYGAYRALLRVEPEGGPDLETHWRLSQLLIKRRRRTEAIETLKRLLARHPHAACSLRAQYELGVMYAESPSRREQAIDYLRGALRRTAEDAAPAPGVKMPVALSAQARGRAQALLARLLGEVQAELQPGEPDAEDRREKPDGSAAPAAQASDSSIDLRRVFGGVEDSQAQLPPSMDETGARTPPPVAPAEETEGPINLEAMLGGPEASEAESGEGEKPAPKPEAGDEDSEARELPQKYEALPEEIEFKPQPERPRKRTARRGDQRPWWEGPPEPLPETRRVGDYVHVRPEPPADGDEPIRLRAEAFGGGLRLNRDSPTTSSAPKKGKPEAAAPDKSEKKERPPRADETRASTGKKRRRKKSRRKKAATRGGGEETRPSAAPLHVRLRSEAAERHESAGPAPDRAPRFPAGGRYSVILPPGVRARMSLIRKVLQSDAGPRRGLSPEAVKRRRGILAQGLARREALRLGHHFADAGLDVMIVEHDDRIDYPEALDVTGIAAADPGIRFTTRDRVYYFKWKNFVAVGAGMVHNKPDEAGKAPAPQQKAAELTIDVFTVAPRLHLRMRAGRTHFDHQFKYTMPEAGFTPQVLVQEIAIRVPGVVRTGNVGPWLRSTQNEPEGVFEDLAEYEDYLLWHLMACRARVKYIDASGIAQGDLEIAPEAIHH